MDILWIIKRIRKIKLMSNHLSSDQKLKSKYLIIDDSDSDIQQFKYESQSQINNIDFRSNS